MSDTCCMSCAKGKKCESTCDPKSVGLVEAVSFEQVEVPVTTRAVKRAEAGINLSRAMDRLFPRRGR